jgi:hypothetical protein
MANFGGLQSLLLERKFWSHTDMEQTANQVATISGVEHNLSPSAQWSQVILLIDSSGLKLIGR